MGIPLLATKNYLPRIRPEIVTRPELVNRINSGLDRKLALISAPAGFGKTTLLSEWAGQCERPVGWVTLDEGDNDPTQFWLYIIAALDSIHTGFGESVSAMLRSSQAPPLQMLLTFLINEIAEILPPCAIVLDDYHLINKQVVHDAVSYFIEHMPPEMHLIIATRSDPPLPIGSLRGQGRLNELRKEDLRFSRDETVAFLNRYMGLNLQYGDIEILGERTEGWVVGLQLAALSIREQVDKHSFVVDMAGDNRYIADYLLEEVLKQQPERIQEFLIKTSILDNLSGSICQALTGFEDSNAILVSLEQNNVFILSMDQQRVWFRYHRLFADLLRVRLKQMRPDPTAELHQRASLWYEEHCFTREAIKHALEVDDFDRTAVLLEGHGFDLINQGEIGSVSDWLDEIPLDYFQANPWLNIARAWTLISAGELHTVERLLNDIESGYHVLPNHKRFYGHCAALRSCIGGLRGDPMMALRYSREALRNLPETEYLARGLASMMLGLGLRWNGELRAAVDAYSEAEEVGRKAGDIFIAVFASCYKGYAFVLCGQLHQGEKILRSAIQYAESSSGRGSWKPPISGLAHSFLCSALLEWNEMELALTNALTGLALSEKLGHTHAILDSYYFLINSLINTGDIDGAKEAIRNAKENAADFMPLFSLDIAILEIELHLAIGDVILADQQLEDLGIHANDDISFLTLTYYLPLARVLWKRGNLKQALHLIDCLLRVAEDAGAITRVIEILIMKALVLYRLNNKLQAVNLIGRALTLAEPEGFIWSFIRHGKPVEELLHCAAADGIYPVYVSKLLAALKERARFMGEKGMPPPESIFDPLSDRELQVLRLLVAGLSSNQIAEELIIAVGTARTHIKHIYRKLDVHRRLEVIERAKELRLV